MPLHPQPCFLGQPLGLPPYHLVAGSLTRVPGDAGPEIPDIPRDRVISAPHLRLGVSSEPVEHTQQVCPESSLRPGTVRGSPHQGRPDISRSKAGKPASAAVLVPCVLVMANS